MRHLSSTFSCSRAQDSFKFSLIFSHSSLITQIISSVNAIFHQRRNTCSSTTSVVSPPFDKTYFSLTFLMCGFYLNPSSAPYFLRLRMCLGQPLTQPWHHTVLLASSNPLRFLPSHFLSLSQALWVIFQLLIFSLPLPLYPFLSRCQFSSLHAKKKSEKVKSLKSDAQATCPFLSPGIAEADITTLQSEEGVTGTPLFLLHSDKCLSTPTGVS